VAVLLALASALVYGVADYTGGRASRVHPAFVVTFVGQAVVAPVLLVAALASGTPFPDGSTVWWSMAGGAIGSLALAGLYYSFSHGAITIVAPVSAAVGAIVPLLVGLATGDRPGGLAVSGMLVAVIAVVLVSGAVGERHVPTPSSVVALAAAAGAGFGFMYVALARTADDAGIWPVAIARWPTLVVLGAACVLSGARPGAQRSVLVLAVLAAVLDNAANLLYLLSTREGLLSVVAVISSLYPASTVTLAFVLDRERVSRWQAAGMVLVAVALVLVTLGR
jgi:drug/metabolite transporter (DMT)-like permease